MSPGEGIPVLGRKMKNLALGDSSVNKSGVASSQVINVTSNAEGAGNKSETGLSRILRAWLVNLSVTCLFIAYAVYHYVCWVNKEDSLESRNNYLPLRSLERVLIQCSETREDFSFLSLFFVLFSLPITCVLPVHLWTEQGNNWMMKTAGICFLHIVQM